jgi:hypothetical protein
MLTRSPKLLGLAERSDADIRPPALLVTDTVQFPVMIATKRYSKFIAYLATESPRLGEFQMVAPDVPCLDAATSWGAE